MGGDKNVPASRGDEIVEAQKQAQSFRLDLEHQEDIQLGFET